MSKETGTNYIADREQAPQWVCFDNGRTVWIAFDSDLPHLEVGWEQKGEKWLRHMAAAEDAAGSINIGDPREAEVFTAAELAAPISSAVDDVPDLYRLAYIPGCFRCPKCEFAVSKQTISMAQGCIGTTEENRQSEQCPNDGTWMVHVSYRERLAEYEKRVFAEIDLNRAQAALLANKDAEIARLRKGVEYAIHFFNSPASFSDEEFQGLAERVYESLDDKPHTYVGKAPHLAERCTAEAELKAEKELREAAEYQRDLARNSQREMNRRLQQMQRDLNAGAGRDTYKRYADAAYHCYAEEYAKRNAAEAELSTLRKRVEELEEQANGACKAALDYEDLAEAAESALAALKAESQWVDVKERLPESQGCYLVFWRYPNETAEEGHYNFADFDEYGDEEGKLDWEDDSVRGLYTHWRPLPSPPTTEPALDAH